MVDERADFIRGLRELADFYDARPELPLPSEVTVNLTDVKGKAELAHVAELMKPCKKEVTLSFYKLIRHFGPIVLEAYDWRSNICERIVTGTKVVAEKIVPAQEEEVIPEHEEDIVVWKCPDSLLEASDA